MGGVRGHPRLRRRVLRAVLGIAVGGPGRAVAVSGNGPGISRLVAWTDSLSPPPPPPPPPPPCSITGTEGDDVLRGTDGPDVICGLGGDDRIVGLGGDDVIDGGAGNDRIRGNAGKDDLRGGAGRDVITGEEGDDLLNGGADDDRLDGKAGVDTVHGGAGGDLVIGGYDADVLYGDDGSDVVMDGVGRNRFDGGAGNDWIYARNSRRETVACGAGVDRYQVDTKRPDTTTGCERRLPILATPHVRTSPPPAKAADVSEGDVVSYSGRAPSYWPHNSDTRTWLGVTARGCLSDGSGAGSAAAGETFGGAVVGLWASVRDRDVGRKKWVRFEYKKQVWSQQGWSLNPPYAWHDTIGDDRTTTSGRAKGFHPRWKQRRILAWHEAGALYRVLVRVSWFHDVFGPRDRIARTGWINVIQCRANDETF
jgi:RTX calcium-binding nonapeptide repeat (4 copies)